MAALNQSEAARVALIRERFADYLKMIDSVLPLRDDQLASFSNDQITTLAAQAGVSADGLLRDESVPPPVADPPSPDKERSNGKGDLEKILSVIKRQQDAIDKLAKDHQLFQSRLSPLVSAWESEMGGPTADGAAPGGAQDGKKQIANVGNSLISQIIALGNTTLGQKIIDKFGGNGLNDIQGAITTVNNLKSLKAQLDNFFTNGAVPLVPAGQIGALPPQVPSDVNSAYQRSIGFNEGLSQGFNKGIQTATGLVKSRAGNRLFETETPPPAGVYSRREPPPRRPKPKDGPCRINLNDR